jgi:hypothetical protein
MTTIVACLHLCPVKESSKRAKEVSYLQSGGNMQSVNALLCIAYLINHHLHRASTTLLVLVLLVSNL